MQISFFLIIVLIKQKHVTPKGFPVSNGADKRLNGRLEKSARSIYAPGGYVLFLSL